jgi:hypothetical protein
MMMKKSKTMKMRMRRAKVQKMRMKMRMRMSMRMKMRTMGERLLLVGRFVEKMTLRPKMRRRSVAPVPSVRAHTIHSPSARTYETKQTETSIERSTCTQCDTGTLHHEKRGIML